MLRTLSIRDFVIVDRLDLEFQEGFTVLTGETGAGKSILIDALALVLGERSDPGLVREGCARAEIGAEFSLEQVARAQAWLDAGDLADETGVCVLRRVLEASGRSRAYVNGRPATLAQLKELGELLIDIHGQHEHQSLLRAGAQRELLDAYAGAAELAREVAQAWREWQESRRRREESESNAQALAAEREQLQWQVQELSRLAFSAQEWDDAAGRSPPPEPRGEPAGGGRVRARVAVRGRGGGACRRRGGRCAPRARPPSTIRGSRRPSRSSSRHRSRSRRRCTACATTARASTSTRAGCRRSRNGSRPCTRRRASTGSVPSVCPRRSRSSRERLAALGDEASAEELKRRESAAAQAYRQAAQRLSRERARAAAELGRRVTEQMQGLAMAGGRFEIALTPVETGSADGLERVEFLVAANPGAALRPLAKVASGGELSRLSLAIQTVTTEVAEVPTLVFDEVDAGIGGRVAEIVGRMLKQLGRSHQVMCITHLPQVAAAADQQWQVSKSEVAGKVRSHVRPLDRAERVEELARMLGGVKITETTRKHAAEMLG